jgi:hypothetical protein
MNAENSLQPALVKALVLHGQATLDLVWALEWLDTLSDRLTGDHMVAEFMAELEHRRTQSDTLNSAAKEAGI